MIQKLAMTYPSGFGNFHSGIIFGCSSEGNEKKGEVMRARMFAVLLLGIATCISGCGLTLAQRDATLKFANAAARFGDMTSSELVRMRDQTVLMNTALYRIPDLPKESRMDQDTHKETEPLVQVNIDQGEYKHLADYFESTWYSILLSGPIAMKAYGIAITNMMNADNSVQIKDASDNLAAALRAIPGSPIANASSKAISGLSQQLTEWVLADMKAHAIRSVVQSANEVVAQICGKIGADFSVIPDIKNLPWRFRETSRLLYTAAEQGMKNNKAVPLARSDSLAGFAIAQSNLEYVKAVFPQIVTASKQCVAANTALVDALNNKVYSVKDIEDFSGQVINVYEYLKTLAPPK